MQLKLFLAIALLTCSTFSQSAISSDSLFKIINGDFKEDFYLIDVRNPDELISVIGTAQCKPYNLSFNLGTLESNLSNLNKNKWVITYCRSGGRSTSAAILLASKGFTKVNTAGGILNYNHPKIAGTNIRPIADLPAPTMAYATSLHYAMAKNHNHAVVNNTKQINLIGQRTNEGLKHKRIPFRFSPGRT